jgi:hypothetical protein
MKRATRTGRPVAAVVAIVGLLSAGALRYAAEATRAWASPSQDVTAGQGVRLAQLDSYALGLLLGGLRGPLVMALWSGMERLRIEGAFDELDERNELIRLLQPQFDSVHIQLARMSAYDVSAQQAGVASRYNTIVEAIGYLARVQDERPPDIELATETGKLLSNKLGAADEAEYFSRRVRQETQARQPAVRLEFDQARETELRNAAARAGIASRELIIRPAGTPGRIVALLPAEAGQRLQGFDGDDVARETLDPPDKTDIARTDGRIPTVLDDAGNLLPRYADPRRDAPDDALDGAPLQFLRDFAPFPEGISPLALAYNEFQRARVLQEFAGQRHVQEGQGSVMVNPGRALRDWALEAYEVGRQLEAEAYGRQPPRRSTDGQLQARLELVSADMPPDRPVVAPALLDRARTYYRRAANVARRASAFLTDHVEQFPESANIFVSNVDRLDLFVALLEADLAYLDLLQDAPDAPRPEAVAALYEQADVSARDFLLKYHVMPQAMPNGVPTARVMDLPPEVREIVYRQMLGLQEQALRANRFFDADRVLLEFEGYRERTRVRRALL